MLCDEIATLARTLCTENVNFSKIETLLACRLVPLIKTDSGVRPIGIGEVLRRIIGKSIGKLLRKDIQKGCGTLQTCTGIESGIEAAIHALKQKFDSDECEAVWLMDADNAFNRLNRATSLKNIEQICPPLFQYMSNSYSQPSKLFLTDGQYIMSEEGAVQGDNLAMAKYAIATKPLVDELSQKVEEENLLQVWFADDGGSGGTLEGLKVWWDHLNLSGPKYGVHPKHSKSILILKNPDDYERARNYFGEELQITAEGGRHIGAVIGTDSFKELYVSEKVTNWVKDIEKLAEIAKEDPQAALCGYNTGLCRRWAFIQRTVEDVGPFFEPIENVLRNAFIPNIIGRPISNLERNILSLPYRYGGLGIQNPVESAPVEYNSSKEITAQLTNLIANQDTDVSKIDYVLLKQTKARLKAERENALKQKAEELMASLPQNEARSFLTAQERGASAWLSTLPLKMHGYSLNKKEFRDALCLRYGWKVPDAPTHCACGKLNSINHTLICPKGGYVSLRHNALRNTEAMLMEDVCQDVQLEPPLLATVEEQHSSSNNSDKARLDISARGIFGLNERTFFDVRVTHPNADTYKDMSLEQVYHIHESSKKNTYNSRILEIEKGSFIPLVFTTSGGFGPECERFNKRLAELIAKKRNQQYSEVMKYIRTRLRFALLRSTLVAIRGERGKRKEEEDNMGLIDFNLIPTEACYEI